MKQKNQPISRKVSRCCAVVQAHRERCLIDTGLAPQLSRGSPTSCRRPTGVVDRVRRGSYPLGVADLV